MQWEAEGCHWQELPQVSFLLQQKFCHDKHMLVTTKHVFCHDKSMFVATDICHDKHRFVATKVCLSWQNSFSQQKYFVVTNVWSQQACFCHSKCVFVATKLLSWQKFYLWQFPSMIEGKVWYGSVLWSVPHTSLREQATGFSFLFTVM